MSGNSYSVGRPSVLAALATLESDPALGWKGAAGPGPESGPGTPGPAGFGPGAPQYAGGGPGTPHSQGSSFTPPAVPPHFPSPGHPASGPPGAPFSASPAPAGGPSPYPTPPASGPPSGPFPAVSTPGPHPGQFGGPGGPQGMMPGMPGGPFTPLGPHHGPFAGPFPPHGPPFGPPQHMGGPMHGPGGPMGHGPMGPGGPMGPDRMEHGRHTPYFNQPDYRIHELNKRLQQKSEDSDSLWWDAFATEFFEDDATLTLTFCLEDGPKRYMIGRTLIPRYFRSIFEGGVTELYFSLRHPKESFHTTSITLDCDTATMVTHHGKPLLAKVCTEGRFIVEFTFDDLMRIKSWHFATRGVKELIPRSVLALHAQQEPALAEQLGKNITRQGLTNVTLNYLRLCVILEPMQELMTRHKAYSLSPRDCLKTTLFQKWQRMVAPPGGPNHPHSKPEENQRPPSKRRKRKTPTGGGTTQSKQKGRPPFNLSAGQVSDVMVVGEPSLMGGEFGDEDERLITRLENAQTDASAAGAGGGGGGGGATPGGAPPTGAAPAADENNYTSSPLTSGGSWTSGERPQPPPPPQQASTPNSQDSQEKKSPPVGQ